MIIAADYPFLDVLWTMIIFFCWVVWIWMMIVLLSDVFSRRDIGGWAKAGWVIFMILTPFLGALVYLIAQHDGLTQRRIERMQEQQQMFQEQVRAAAGTSGGGGGAAGEIAQAKTLLDQGAISQAEFDALKTKALAGGAA